MSRAVADALEAAPPEDRDAGAVALCVRYARLIDEAAPAAKYRKALNVLEAIAGASGHPGADEMLRTITAALAAHSVASDLGPKLLAALTSLGLSVAGRSKTIKETPDGPVPGADELAALREERARQHGA